MTNHTDWNNSSETQRNTLVNGCKTRIWLPSYVAAKQSQTTAKRQSCKTGLISAHMVVTSAPFSKFLSVRSLLWNSQITPNPCSQLRAVYNLMYFFIFKSESVISCLPHRKTSRGKSQSNLSPCLQTSRDNMSMRWGRINHRGKGLPANICRLSSWYDCGDDMQNEELETVTVWSWWWWSVVLHSAS